MWFTCASRPNNSCKVALPSSPNAPRRHLVDAIECQHTEIGDSQDGEHTSDYPDLESIGSRHPKRARLEPPHSNSNNASGSRSGESCTRSRAGAPIIVGDVPWSPRARPQFCDLVMRRRDRVVLLQTQRTLAPAPSWRTHSGWVGLRITRVRGMS